MLKIVLKFYYSLQKKYLFFPIVAKKVSIYSINSSGKSYLTRVPFDWCLLSKYGVISRAPEGWERIWVVFSRRTLRRPLRGLNWALVSWKYWPTVGSLTTPQSCPSKVQLQTAFGESSISYCGSSCGQSLSATPRRIGISRSARHTSDQNRSNNG